MLISPQKIIIFSIIWIVHLVEERDTRYGENPLIEGVVFYPWVGPLYPSNYHPARGMDRSNWYGTRPSEERGRWLWKRLVNSFKGNDFRPSIPTTKPNGMGTGLELANQLIAAMGVDGMKRLAELVASLIPPIVTGNSGCGLTGQIPIDLSALGTNKGDKGGWIQGQRMKGEKGEKGDRGDCSCQETTTMGPTTTPTETSPTTTDLTTEQTTTNEPTTDGQTITTTDAMTDGTEGWTLPAETTTMGSTTSPTDEPTTEQTTTDGTTEWQMTTDEYTDMTTQEERTTMEPTNAPTSESTEPQTDAPFFPTTEETTTTTTEKTTTQLSTQKTTTTTKQPPVTEPVVVDCDETIVYENATWQSSNLFDPESEPNICVLTIRLNSSDRVDVVHEEPICQIRLDFKQFSIAQPNRQGNCVTDNFRIFNADNNIPIICGDNPGQHMHLKPRSNAKEVRLAYKFSQSSVRRLWNIRVTLIPCCANHLLAPPDCLQYFNNYRGIVQSFNWIDSPFVVSSNQPRQLANQHYNICFRADSSANAICYTPCQSSGFAFSISQNAQRGPFRAGAGVADCSDDFLLIANGYDKFNKGQINDRFCGTIFNPNGKVTVDQLYQTAKASTTICSDIKPFHFHYTTNMNELPGDVANNGFCLEYKQKQDFLTIRNETLHLDEKTD